MLGRFIGCCRLILDGFSIKVVVHLVLATIIEFMLVFCIQNCIYGCFVSNCKLRLSWSLSLIIFCAAKVCPRPIFYDYLRISLNYHWETESKSFIVAHVIFYLFWNHTSANASRLYLQILYFHGHHDCHPFICSNINIFQFSLI